ncbi:MGMT family protein [Shewanella algae]|uniref:MGMT family protein n=1 Tax=Shewanella algae TaxID=38313 RepID=UPI001F0C9DB2|nr:MGMT family protein [Shewanella algae]MDL2193562.1 MGMT family protein [Shewanella algae]UZD60546.1 MGMT family protein [Shewanella algae]
MTPETSAPLMSPMQKIWHIVALIPEGRVASYGKIADYAGLPGRARYVSRALKQAPDSLALPWHRVINSQGKISFAKDTHPFQLQMSLLRSEGVQVNQGRIALSEYEWRPDMATLVLSMPF